MRWISFKSSLRHGVRRSLVRTKRALQWEEWVTVCDGKRCRVLDGKRYVVGKGPRPGVDTPVGCLCYRERVLGRFAPSPRRLVRAGSFAAYSCKDCD